MTEEQQVLFGCAESCINKTVLHFFNIIRLLSLESLLFEIKAMQDSTSLFSCDIFTDFKVCDSEASALRDGWIIYLKSNTNFW